MEALLCTLLGGVLGIAAGAIGVRYVAPWAFDRIIRTMIEKGNQS